jgi:hypothetical protein
VPSRFLLLSLALVACGRTELSFESDGGVDGGVTRNPPVPASCPSVSDSAFLAKWNDAAQGVTASGRDFQWSAPDDFPHPTYRGGSMDAYTKAAGIVTRLLAQSDTACFASLMDRAWKYGCMASACKTVTMRNFAIDLCSGNSSALVSAQERTALCEACRPWGC